MVQTTPANAQMMKEVWVQWTESNKGPGEAKMPVPMRVPMIYNLNINVYVYVCVCVSVYVTMKSARKKNVFLVSVFCSARSTWRWRRQMVNLTNYRGRRTIDKR